MIIQSKVPDEKLLEYIYYDAAKKYFKDVKPKKLSTSKHQFLFDKNGK